MMFLIHFCFIKSLRITVYSITAMLMPPWLIVLYLGSSKGQPLIIHVFFISSQYSLTLCARCFVRGNCRVGMNSSDFRRVEISEEPRTDWTDRETLRLLESIMHYGDDWRRVAQYVGGRTEKDCIAHFIRLPFGEEFLNHQYSGASDDDGNQLKEPIDADSGLESIDATESSKTMSLTPLADASNPIMAQVRFPVQVKVTFQK